MAIGAFALLSCALIIPTHPLVRPRSPQCMMKSYDTSKPYDAASSPEPLGEEEEELMATLVEPAASEPAVVEPAADDTAAIGDDEQELLMALRRARARGGVAELIELGRAIETADSAGVDAASGTMVEARQYAEENGGFLVKVAESATKAAESVAKFTPQYKLPVYRMQVMKRRLSVMSVKHAKLRYDVSLKHVKSS